MWEIKNSTPFKADGCFARDKDGTEYWVIAIKACFSYADNSSPFLKLMLEQQDINFYPQYYDKQEFEIKEDTDITPFKLSTDIAVTGYVELEQNRQYVELTCGEITKSAYVFGDYYADGKGWNINFFEGNPKDKIAIRWRNCLGGKAIDGESYFTGNLIGTGYIIKPHMLEEKIKLPNFLSDTEINKKSFVSMKHLGFGFISPSWQPRLQYAGTYDEKWEITKSPLLPDDFNHKFWHSVSTDQIYPQYLKGGEKIILKGFHKDSDYSFIVPQILFSGYSQWNGYTEDIKAFMTLLHINTEDRTVCLTWNIKQECIQADKDLKYTSIKLKQASGVIL